MEQQATLSSPPARLARPMKTRSEVQRLFHGIHCFMMIGGDPRQKHERDSQMRTLVRTSGRSAKDIEGVSDLMRNGAMPGARRKIEGWYTINQA